MSNEAQKDFWNGPAGDVWVEAQGYMDQILAPLSELATTHAASQANERAIDVGCGCGATTFAFADSGCAVWGVDISEPMLAKAKERAKEQGIENVAFSVTDAASQDYTPDHDIVFSRFGVMFFDDPKAAFH
ncbi:MAG: methyltransferase domain-containing protein [Pseudomonadales bacterium]|nr:methyltransferase domain-containing protein [Pseudomonadales bacterium]